MKLFLKFLNEKRNTIIIFFFFLAVYCAALILYRMPIESIVYPAVICVIFGILFLIFDFLRTKKRHREFIMLKDSTCETLSLPKSETISEEDYAEICKSLCAENIENRAEAQKSYRDMIDYYTVWAHQIKTPIASMKLALENEDTDLSRHLNAQLFRTQQYADMVLAFLRLDSDSSDYLFAEYSLDDILRQSFKKFAPDFIGRKLYLEFNPTGISVVTDEKWLSFVIEQLLSNALKYTVCGGITTEKVDQNTIVIRDTGIGIAREDLPRIFEKGYTGVSGRTDKSSSGLGLYLVHRICENLGIGIKITSDIGKGTQVYLSFKQEKSVFE
ncbi:MAG: sensor histidine kinase [Clostridiales bacterium]|nr:sensor histidine kinase [Candidatus Equinaster intestinalis]